MIEQEGVVRRLPPRSRLARARSGAWRSGARRSARPRAPGRAGAPRWAAGRPPTGLPGPAVVPGGAVVLVDAGVGEHRRAERDRHAPGPAGGGWFGGMGARPFHGIRSGLTWACRGLAVAARAGAAPTGCRPRSRAGGTAATGSPRPRSPRPGCAAGGKGRAGSRGRPHGRTAPGSGRGPGVLASASAGRTRIRPARGWARVPGWRSARRRWPAKGWRGHPRRGRWLRVASGTATTGASAGGGGRRRAGAARRNHPAGGATPGQDWCAGGRFRGGEAGSDGIAAGRDGVAAAGTSGPGADGGVSVSGWRGPGTIRPGGTDQGGMRFSGSSQRNRPVRCRSSSHETP